MLCINMILKTTKKEEEEEQYQFKHTERTSFYPATKIKSQIKNNTTLRLEEKLDKHHPIEKILFQERPSLVSHITIPPSIVITCIIK